MTDLTDASYLDPGFITTSTDLSSLEFSCSSSALSLTCLPLTKIIGVPLPNTSKASSFKVTPGSLSSTSVADPDSASTLFSIFVTRASPWISVFGRTAFTTALPSTSVSGVSLISSMSFKALYWVSYPMNVTWTHAASGWAAIANLPAVSATAPAMYVESLF